MNWLDFVLILLFFLNIVSGFQSGLIAGMTELISLIISLIVAVVTFPFFASGFHSIGFSNDLALFFGFGFVFVGMQIALAIATIPFTRRLKRGIKDTFLGDLNRWVGPIPHIFMFFISASFILAAFIVFPIFTPVKSAITSSRFGLKLAAPAVTILKPASLEFKHEAKSAAN